MLVSFDTALKIAHAYREIECAEQLLTDINEAMSRHSAPDIRDAFGRRADGLQLGVPSGENGHRLFNVPWALARPVIEAHLAQQRAVIGVLSEKARVEIEGEKEISSRG